MYYSLENPPTWQGGVLQPALALMIRDLRVLLFLCEVKPEKGTKSDL